ncbi:WAP domain containing protein, SLPI-like [Trichuris trichiura]|uniref:WAP domain containing protein, SLPI-like n=1 Tax=Trichuris trichiura TaxID=36087 RepID=A0A077ZDT1_TRITR|nr:WAP domain containing protein, SLPI-like [Trichuris trichiura]
MDCSHQFDRHVTNAYGTENKQQHIDGARCPDGTHSAIMCITSAQCSPWRGHCIRGQCCPMNKSLLPQKETQECPFAAPLKQIRSAKPCVLNTDCKSPERCCDTEFGSHCLSPLKINYRTCPKVTTRSVNQENRCQSDEECEGQMKCCELPTGKVCLFPVEFM